MLEPGAIAVPLTERLDAMLSQSLARQADDPFGNPVLAVAFAIGREIEDGTITEDAIADTVRELRDDAFRRRAIRLAAYVGLPAPDPERRFRSAAERLVRPDPHDSPVPLARFREQVERVRFACVFTAHPTFALPPDVYAALVALATGGSGHRAPAFETHRPGAITLDQEFAQAFAAIERGRDAVDRLTAELLRAARGVWPNAWRDLAPRAIVLASWVGYDTDGRTDIGWHDTLRLRLRMKRAQLARLATQLEPVTGTETLRSRLAAALDAVDDQIACCPSNNDPADAARFARALIDRSAEALRSPSDLAELLAAAGALAGPDEQIPLAVARAGLLSHGLSLSHTHMRLNATQVHNVARQRLGITDGPEDVSRRRALLARINDALDETARVPFDLGALLAEQASAARLMMVAATIIKHIDQATPIRFLIAETESGYTLLCALWLARLLGIERKIEISPLFETVEALERGVRVVDEALRSPHYQDYVRTIGRLCLQFGYSDSGRYVGQMAATYQIERLRLKIADLLRTRDLGDIEVVLFDTHGESIGRGGHPGSLADRLAYLSPPWTRANFRRANVAIREESAFQGGDGYALFGTPLLAEATIATVAEHAFAIPEKSGAGQSGEIARDPIYDDPDFSADFFATIASSMQALVDDPGYAALLGAFGPALIDKTGSRPAARQSDASGAPARIRHPGELRAIPNNAILQQLGWCANTLQGLGAAAARHPEAFERLSAESRRFRRALDFASHALAHSSRDVLRATVVLLDPGTWLDRAANARTAETRQDLVHVAHGLKRLDLWASTQAMLHRIEDDNLNLREAWADAPGMAIREVLLHALRLALIERIWRLAARIPYFAPRGGLTRDTLEDQMLRLDITAALDQLRLIFPHVTGEASRFDFREPSGPRSAGAYRSEHDLLFEPIDRLFGLVREIGTAIMHEVGAFG